MGRARSAAWPRKSVNNPERLVQGNSSCLFPQGCLQNMLFNLQFWDQGRTIIWDWNQVFKGSLFGGKRSFPSCVFEACLMSAEGNLDQCGSSISQNNCKVMCKCLSCAPCGVFLSRISPQAPHLFALLAWDSLPAGLGNCWTNGKTCRAR